MECRQCGAEAEGRFCGACGATLREIPCPGCRAPAPAGQRYCTGCGSGLQGSRPSAPSAPSRRGELGWWLAGALMVVLLGLGGWSFASDGEPAPAPQGLGPAPEVDLSSMSPREAADRLFDRVMRAVAQDDTSEVRDFQPMAVDAYELARPLDQDGLFHLSVLHAVGGDFHTALDTALEGLREEPDHLLNRSAAAEAAQALGDEAQAAEHYRHLLEVWDREMARDDRLEYVEHAALLPTLRSDAREFLDAREP